MNPGSPEANPDPQYRSSTRSISFAKSALNLDPKTGYDRFTISQAIFYIPSSLFRLFKFHIWKFMHHQQVIEYKNAQFWKWMPANSHKSDQKYTYVQRENYWSRNLKFILKKNCLKKFDEKGRWTEHFLTRYTKKLLLCCRKNQFTIYNKWSLSTLTNFSVSPSSYLK